MTLTVKLVVEILILCEIFSGLVVIGIRNGAVNQLYLYPKKIKNKAYELGLTTKKKMITNAVIYISIKVFLCAIYITYAVIVMNKARTFESLFFQSLLILEVLNIFYCIVVDLLWMRYGKIWLIPDMEDMRKDYAPIGYVLFKFLIKTVAIVAGSALFALIANLIIYS